MNRLQPELIAVMKNALAQVAKEVRQIRRLKHSWPSGMASHPRWAIGPTPPAHHWRSRTGSPDQPTDNLVDGVWVAHTRCAIPVAVSLGGTLAESTRGRSLRQRSAAAIT